MTLEITVKSIEKIDAIRKRLAEILPAGSKLGLSGNTIQVDCDRRLSVVELKNRIELALHAEN